MAYPERVARHPLIVTYLERLERAGAYLPPDRRQALVWQVDAWLSEALGAQPTPSEVRSALAGLGTPQRLAALEESLP